MPIPTSVSLPRGLSKGPSPMAKLEVAMVSKTRVRAQPAAGSEVLGESCPLPQLTARRMECFRFLSSGMLTCCSR